MEIRLVTKAQINSATSGADLFSLAKASFMFDVVKASASVLAYVSLTGEGNTILTGDLLAGTSTATQNVAPAYFPVATFGAECGAVVNDLSWADQNLNKGYEYIVTSIGQATSFFVSGVLNSTQTLSNDPFAQSQVTSASCWTSSYAQGVNPF